MIFARIGHGPCYYHWNEIFAGVPLLPILFDLVVEKKSLLSFALFHLKQRAAKVISVKSWQGT